MAMEVHFSQDEQAKLDSAAARIGMNPERLVTHVVAAYLSVENDGTISRVERRKSCPECGHQFRGNGFDGIDAHWRANHEGIMPYSQAWPLIQSGEYAKRPQKTPTTLVELFAPVRGLNMDFERSADLDRNFDL